MRQVVRSRTYVEQLQALLEEGITQFGSAVATRTLDRIDRAITLLAHFPASKPADPHLALTVYPISRTPFVILYDFDDAELRVHFIMHARADRRDLDAADADWSWHPPSPTSQPIAPAIPRPGARHAR